MRNIRWVLLLLFAGWSSTGSAQQLEKYIEKALEHNAGLKASYAEFEAALRQVPQVSSLPDPTLTVGAFGRMMETPMGREEASISLMQMFPWFGTLKAREDRAVLLADAKFKAYLDVRNSLVLKVSEQYYALYALEKSIQYQQDNLKILKDYKQLSLAKVSGGSGALSDVLRADLLKEEALTEIKVLKLEKEALEERFFASLNWQEDDRVVDLPEQLEVELQVLPEGISANPRLAQVDHLIAAAEKQERIAIKSGYPNLGLGVEYMVMSKTEGSGMMPAGGGEDSFMPMLSVSIPIFRKKYRAAEEEAQWMKEQYRQQKLQLNQDLQADYQSARLELQQAQVQVELNEKQVTTTGQVLELLLSAYSNANAEFEEILELQQTLLRYQLKLAQAESQYYTAVARINYLTGNPLYNEDQQ